MSWKTKTLLVVFGLIVLSGSTASRGEDSRDPSHFTYARLYCAPDGNTRFQDMTAELRKTDFAPPAPPIHIGSDFAASRAFFGGFEAGWGARDLENRLNHPTPATQFGIVLQGAFSITTTDGETRRLPPGSVFRLEDTSPARAFQSSIAFQILPSPLAKRLSVLGNCLSSSRTFYRLLTPSPGQNQDRQD